MKVIIIDTAGSIETKGARIISSVLKAKGHQTRMIFLPVSLKDWYRGPYLLDNKSINSFIEVIKNENPDIIGISVSSPYLERAIQINDAINNNFDLFVVWGGVHVTAYPENSIRYSFNLCIGEGEEAILELVDRLERNKEYYDLEGFWFKKNGVIIKNKFRQPPKDLNKLPFPDYELRDHYILKKEEIVKMTEEDFKENIFIHSFTGIPKFYIMFTMRGGPHNCSFCYNTFIKEKYGFTKLRFMHVENIVKEIEWIKTRFPFFRSIRFMDDDFFARSLDEIKEFSKIYKQQCAMPFSCYCNPNTLIEEKLKLLIECGLKRLGVGIETGSDRINRQIYNRNTPRDEIIEKINMLNTYQKRGIQIWYEFLIDNPFEKNNDIIESIDLVSKISRHSVTHFYSLRLFPNSSLYFKAVKEGRITVVKDKKQFLELFESSFGKFSRTKHNYLTYVLLLQNIILRDLPNFILRFFTNRLITKLFDIIPISYLNFILGRCIFPKLILFKRTLRIVKNYFHKGKAKIKILKEHPKYIVEKVKKLYNK
jgi:radical SAM superfamily enzyme YgiQ (UPF0313 family)